MRLARLALGLSVAALAIAPAAAKKPSVYALVVGADHYKSFPTLLGADNDARLIAETLRATGASEVQSLTDSQVTRSAIFEKLNGLIGRAQPGDWIVFTYAGHGGREGNLSSFVLPRYADSRPDNAERIREHELRKVFDGHPGINFIFLADSCFSGSMARSLDTRATEASMRSVHFGPVDDVLEPPPDANPQSNQPANVVFVGATLATRESPEIPLDGKYHGITSWFFARALRGDASNGGKTTFGELKHYIEVDARDASGGRQTPIVDVPNSDIAKPLPFPGTATVSGASRAVTVYLAKGGDIAKLHDVARADSARNADFIWDAEAGTVVDNRLKDLVAERITSPALLDAVIAKWRVLPELEDMSARSPLPVQVGPREAGARYAQNETVQICAKPAFDARLTHLTLVDLASTGEVQLLQDEQQDVSLGYRYASPVTPPFGADHVIAIATEKRPDELRKALQTLDRRRAPAALLETLKLHLRKPFALGIAPLYTGLADSTGSQPAETESVQC